MGKTGEISRIPVTSRLMQNPSWPRSGLAGWDARSGERRVLDAHERAATKQTARQTAAHPGFDDMAPSAALLALRICESYSTRLAPCIWGHLVGNAAHEGLCISLHSTRARRSGFAEVAAPRATFFDSEHGRRGQHRPTGP